ncbi:MAG: hypothetical protein AYL29_013620 [Candidatus Bathyarchaeota archaeon B24]|nr:MAG: hypothetical protein AYL29_013620 [Candidatus Bathyarchaeota archaeon B24]
MSRKTYTVTVIATLAVMLTSLLLPVAVNAGVPIVGDDIRDDYALINGVLDTDKYALYPYEAKAITIGLSKYGELIDEENRVGLEYAGERDPFAPPAGTGPAPGLIPMKKWIQGWHINITYNHYSWGRRNVWAVALFADLSEYGGPWIRVDDSYGATTATIEAEEDPRDPGLALDDNGDVVGVDLEYGGRKTNGSVVTEPLKVLYNGPRRFIAMCVNHIYDMNDEGVKEPLVDVVFTIIFNKVKKEVIILKDIKITISKYVVDDIEIDPPDKPTVTVKALVIQFSDRCEWDLGSSPYYTSYAHWYFDLPTAYDEDWTLTPTLPPYWSFPGANPGARDGSQPGSPGTFDVAQIISDDGEYVGWAAYWPSPSDWSVDGAGEWWESLDADDDHPVDGTTEPWLAPLTIGEWDFALTMEPTETGWFVGNRQFRGVTVYGVTDRNNADDLDGNGVDIPGRSNVLDREVLFQLDEIFNPQDLWAVAHKETERHVLFEYDTDCTIVLVPPAIPPDVADWYAYCSFAERVIDLTTDTLLVRDVDYTLSDDGRVIELDPAYEGHDIKVLWSSIRQVEKVDLLTIVGGVLIYRLSHWPVAEDKPVFVIDITDPEYPVVVPSDAYSIDEDGFITFDNETYEIFDGDKIKVIYDVDLGRYEWVVVGTGLDPDHKARNIDSAGAAMVAAAFKNKNMEIGLSGLDIQDLQVVPQVMAGSGTTWTGYYYDPESDKRVALRDDWCTYWPVASSNMIAVGGPGVNMLTYYFNEFTDAFWANPEFADSSIASSLYALTCWNIQTLDPETEQYVIDPSLKAYYADYPDTGYAVIATYKDINGTIGVVVWGLWGRDTYYAAQWLHGDAERGIPPGLVQLQDAPRGITAIVLEIDYSEDIEHPTFTVVECLGTISETLWTHGEEDKGGIHDP